jgi:LDH2 family malate/lactate/ureidoglycolate dehydrogenase
VKVGRALRRDGVQPSEPRPLAHSVNAAQLSDFVAALYRAAGLPDADACLVADTLVTADLWGHSSHGVMRASWYLARLRSGVMQPGIEPLFLVDSGAIALLDGRDGVGQVVAGRAMAEAVARAKRHGVGLVSVRNGNHHGALGYFTRQAATAGCIGLLIANGSPAMAPWGGRRMVVGTNPWSIAAPAGRHPPMMLDIANTAAARGKIFLARQKGLPIPEGWALDADGRPTTDPVAALSGVLLPMAGHKGYAIAAMMDVLAGALSGSGMLTEVAGPYQAERRSRSGHLVLAIDVAAFGPPERFAERVERMIGELRGTPLAEGADEILYPGELEARNEARHQREGLALPPRTRSDLAGAAAEWGVPVPDWAA